MAESKSKGQRRKRSSGGSSSRSRSSSSRGSSRDSSRRDRSPREVVLQAKEQIEELLGRPVEGVLGMEKNGNEWTVTVEVVELQRIPNTTDVLGKYEVTLDKDGEVTGARRTRRYPRSAAGED